MNTTKYQPHTFGQIVFANDESRQLLEDIVTGVMPFPFEGRIQVRGATKMNPVMGG